MSEDFKQAPGHYVAHRPLYPADLVRWLAKVAPRRACAWDCATGAGQAAVGLAEHFQRVIATDINQEQLDHAIAHPRVHYSVSSAEQSSIGSGTVDLITVACGVHWFDRPTFYGTAKRVLAPGGVLAVWTYVWPVTGSKAVDLLLEQLKSEVLKGYWPQVSELYLNGYADLEFPFEELHPPSFSLSCPWGCDELLGFISTWSPVQRYLRQNGRSPLQEVEAEIKQAWNRERPAMPIQLPLYFRVGR